MVYIYKSGQMARGSLVILGTPLAKLRHAWSSCRACPKNPAALRAGGGVLRVPRASTNKTMAIVPLVVCGRAGSFLRLHEFEGRIIIKTWVRSSTGIAANPNVNTRIHCSGGSTIILNGLPASQIHLNNLFEI